jgi:glucosamine--fructose-6-phosphate aminotransferase (isomerizing)
MCGIVWVIGLREAAPLLLEGLRQLEYRGYDSAGIATVNAEHQLSCLRAEGKLVNLTQRFEAQCAVGQCGIGHTRWATHGKPEERNAHPHLDGPGRVAVVQNGIIENYRTLREELQAEGVVFRSDTDTEVIPHLLSRELGRLVAAGGKSSGALLLQAVQAVLPRLHGAYALAVVWAELPGALVVALKAAPLLIGLGEGEFLCASDTPALAGFTRTILPLEDGEVALLTPLGIELYDAAGDRVQRTPSLLSGTEHVADKCSVRHFMLKEINEQPETAALWVARHLPESGGLVALPIDEGVYEGVERIQILACGTSRHAAQVGAYLLDAWVPLVSIAVPGTVFDKVLSNAQEAKTRDAQLIGVAPDSADAELFDTLLPVPTVDELLSPLLTVIPMQLLRHHIAAHRGLDVDQPRKLAKSVTVEQLLLPRRGHP